jgi:hypothetical protein
MHYQKYLAELSPAGRAALAGSTDGLVVMGDEYCKCPPEVAAMATARQYASKSYSDWFANHSRVQGAMHLPLGPRLEFKPILASAIPLASSRRFLFNLIVSPTSASRKRLAANVRRGPDTFIHVTPGFSANASQARGFVPPDQYREILLTSKFTLCPAGHNPEAFRLYEACEAGSVPVVALDEEYLSHACVGAFSSLIDSGAPFVFLRSWDDLEQELRNVVDREGVDARQARLRAWYQTYWQSTAAAFECAVNDRLAARLPQLRGTYVEPSCGDEEEEQDDALAAAAVGARPNLKVKALQAGKFTTPLITGCGRQVPRARARWRAGRRAGGRAADVDQSQDRDAVAGLVPALGGHRRDPRAHEAGRGERVVAVRGPVQLDGHGRVPVRVCCERAPAPAQD